MSAILARLKTKQRLKIASKLTEHTSVISLLQMFQWDLIDFYFRKTTMGWVKFELMMSPRATKYARAEKLTFVMPREMKSSLLSQTSARNAVSAQMNKTHFFENNVALKVNLRVWITCYQSGVHLVWIWRDWEKEITRVSKSHLARTHGKNDKHAMRWKINTGIN